MTDQQQNAVAIAIAAQAHAQQALERAERAVVEAHQAAAVSAEALAEIALHPQQTHHTTRR